MDTDKLKKVQELLGKAGLVRVDGLPMNDGRRHGPVPGNPYTDNVVRVGRNGGWLAVQIPGECIGEIPDGWVYLGVEDQIKADALADALILCGGPEQMDDFPLTNGWTIGAWWILARVANPEYDPKNACSQAHPSLR